MTVREQRKETFKSRVRDAVKKAGSQVALGVVMGKDPSAIHVWLRNGVAYPRTGGKKSNGATLAKLAAYLELPSVESLFVLGEGEVISPDSKKLSSLREPSITVVMGLAYSLKDAGGIAGLIALKEWMARIDQLAKAAGSLDNLRQAVACLDAIQALKTGK